MGPWSSRSPSTALHARLRRSEPANPVRGRRTVFRLKQNTALAYTFQDSVPGADLDPSPARTFDEYLKQFRLNALGAGKALFKKAFSVKESVPGQEISITVLRSGQRH